MPITLSTIQLFFLAMNIILLTGLASKIFNSNFQKVDDAADHSLAPYSLLFKLSFAFLLLSSVFTVLMKEVEIFQYQLASMVLLYVNFSACVKVCRVGITIKERKQGLFISMAVCMCVAVLFIVKPGGLLPV